LTTFPLSLHVVLSPGYGCLLSIILDEKLNAETFFDCLNVRKGPSLGTSYTLSCPYTVLAHYDELAWAAECGVDRRLIRVSVGLEDAEVRALAQER
jgi:cystathionine gamma-synthase